MSVITLCLCYVYVLTGNILYSASIQFQDYIMFETN